MGMVNAVLGAVGPSAYWYLTRSTGAVALVLLTASIVLGIVDVQRFSGPRWPRFVVDALHRRVSMLVLVLLALHIVTSVLDSFAPIGWIDSVLPFVGRYRPLWLGLGTLSFDLLVAVAVTSVLRQRLGYRVWRVTHWLAYACWPIAMVHTLGTGSDVQAIWLLALSAVCLLAVIAAVGLRTISGWPEHARVRAGALGATAIVPIGLLLWLPAGPLGKGWPRRSGTPTSLLVSTRAAAVSAPPTGAASTSSPAQATSVSAPNQPFTANLAGSVTQGPGPGAGLVSVDLITQLTGSPARRLDIRMDGQPSGAGISLLDSRVTLSSATSGAAPFGGRITSLSGNRLVARLQDPGGHSLSLDVTLAIDSQAHTVSGTVSGSPDAGSPGAGAP